jgi:hypothetical protein
MAASLYRWMIESATSYYFWTSTLLVYVYFSYCLYKTAQNCGRKEIASWAFVPILQFILMLKIARIPVWHVLVLLVPAVNVIALAVVWVRIAQNCGLSTMWGVITIIPIINLLAMGKMAGSKPKPSFFDIPSPATRPRTPLSVG